MDIDKHQIDFDSIDPTVRALLPTYIQRRRADVGTIATLLDAGDYTEIRRLAHNMRGSGSAYGLPPVTELGTALEQAAQDKNDDDIVRLIARLESFVTGLKL